MQQKVNKDLEQLTVIRHKTCAIANADMLPIQSGMTYELYLSSVNTDFCLQQTHHYNYFYYCVGSPSIKHTCDIDFNISSKSTEPTDGQTSMIWVFVLMFGGADLIHFPISIFFPCCFYIKLHYESKTKLYQSKRQKWKEIPRIQCRSADNTGVVVHHIII